MASGDTKEEVLEKLKDYAKLVDAPGLNTDEINGINIILESFNAAKSIGITI